MSEIAEEHLSRIRLKIGRVFEDIGKEGDTKLPQPKSNKEAVALEYYVADTLASLAKKRREKAQKECTDVGVFLEERPTEAGLYEQFRGKHVTVSAKVNNPAKRLDQAKLRVELLKKFSAAQVDAIIEASTVENAPAVQYICSVNN